jgi:serine/threonine protein kinase
MTETRFQTEAEAVARLNQPNIVQIYEVGEHAGQPYLALEYVDGCSLEETTEKVAWPEREAAALVETLARALDLAHRRGILHRDLKPSNILLQSGSGGWECSAPTEFSNSASLARDRLILPGESLSPRRALVHSAATL